MGPNIKGYYEEGNKFYNFNNKCGQNTYKQNDEENTSFLGRISVAGKAVAGEAKLAGIDNLVVSRGTKQCCRQHRLCVMGWGEEMEKQWIKGAQTVNGEVCEQQYWECLSSCALMGDLQGDVVDILQSIPELDNDALSFLGGSCPSADEVGGKGRKVWTKEQVGVLAVGGAAKKAFKKKVKKKLTKKDFEENHWKGDQVGRKICFENPKHAQKLWNGPQYSPRQV